jgi:hypothetical protein
MPTDGLFKAMGMVSGLSDNHLQRFRVRAMEIWKDVQANNARLDGCPGPHVFEPGEIDPNIGIVKQYRCTVCKGTTDPAHRAWYERGLAHGRASG